MKRILFTGGSGLIGRNVIPILSKEHHILAPTRMELNLMDEIAIENFIKDNKIEIVIHSANPNPVKNSKDKSEQFFENSLRIFMNFHRVKHLCEYIYFLGSGAELDKRYDIIKLNENAFGKTIPRDEYGFAKYIMSTLTDETICNLRVFACYGPGDYYTKFISHCVRCVLRNQDITIRQDCYFDYIHTDDLAYILSVFINKKPSYNSYNIASGDRKTLYEIANIVLKVMRSDKNIVILKSGFNKEYTPDISRLREEIGDYQFLSLEAGIKTLITHEEEILFHENTCS